MHSLRNWLPQFVANIFVGGHGLPHTYDLPLWCARNRGFFGEIQFTVVYHTSKGIDFAALHWRLHCGKVIINVLKLTFFDRLIIYWCGWLYILLAPIITNRSSKNVYFAPLHRWLHRGKVIINLFELALHQSLVRLWCRRSHHLLIRFIVGHRSRPKDGLLWHLFERSFTRWSSDRSSVWLPGTGATDSRLHHLSLGAWLGHLNRHHLGFTLL